MRIGVIGSGTAGPAAAGLLARAGHEVHLFERARPMTAVGAGLLLQPTGLAVLERMGLLCKALERGSSIRGLYGDTREGKPVLELEYEWLYHGCAALGVHRAMLLELLLAHARAEGVVLHEGKEAVALGDPARPRVEFRCGDSFECDLCVIAAGARSLLRRHPAFGATETEYPWGALWVITPDPELRYGETLRQIYENAQGMVGFLPSGSVSIHGPRTPTVSLFWSERVRDLPAVRGVPLDRWKARVRSFSPLAAPILDRIGSWSEVASAVYLSVSLRRCWAGRVVVIGDAAHAMSPQLGQGANLALMDAAALADYLAAEPRVENALRGYESARRAHTRFYQWASGMLTPLFQGDRESIGPVRDALMHPVSRVPWFRRQFLDSLAGVKTGIWGAMKVPRIAGDSLPS
ncbi:MAG: FAD-dependent oxidoreductase [Phycisphaerales bacterium]